MSDFSSEFIKKQHVRLLNTKQEILDGFKKYDEEVKSHGKVKASEEGDIAQVYLEQKLTISLRDKDMKKLRLIDIALRKIQDGTYGYCEESEEPIEIKRLEKQPWARLSLQFAEELEKNQRLYRKAI